MHERLTSTAGNMRSRSIFRGRGQMSVMTTVRAIARHPLNADRPGRALTRFVRWQIASRIAPGPVIVPFVNDAVLAVARGMTAATGNVYCGLYGFEEMGFLLHALRKGDLFVDVGANIGAYTVLAGAAVGASCIAFEPAPSAFAALQRNIRLNDIGLLCDAHNAAAGGEDGVLLFTNDQGATNHVALEMAKNTISVPVHTLDGVIGDRMPTIAKIDAEGFETEVLKGALGLLGRTSLLAVIIQLNGRGALYGFDEESIRRKMLDCGLRLHRYDPFERKLMEAPRTNAGRYALYCRDTDRVRWLVSSAPRYRVRDRDL